MISEEDTHRTLLIHRIVFEDIYYRQGGEPPVCMHLCCCLQGELPGVTLFFAGLKDSAAHADDTIITWSDPEIGTDIALSFQESVGCSLIWYGPVLSSSRGSVYHVWLCLPECLCTAWLSLWQL